MLKRSHVWSVLPMERVELEVGNWDRLTHLVASGAQSRRFVCQVKIRLLKCETCERGEGLWVVELQLSGAEGTMDQETGEDLSLSLSHTEQPWEKQEWMRQKENRMNVWEYLVRFLHSALFLVSMLAPVIEVYWWISLQGLIQVLESRCGLTGRV